MATTSSDSSKIDGLALIERLKKEPFNTITEEKLESHPYLKAAKSGTLSITQRRAFALEQYHIQKSDATSFASLAGHETFNPSSMTDMSTVPTAVQKPDSIEDLFQFLLNGEIYAMPLLLKHAESLGLDKTSMANHNVSALAQAYPSYWARLALNKQRAAGAAACAVNFPAWGRMCAQLSAALSSDEYGYSSSGDDAIAFIDYFASPIEKLDEMAAAIIESEGVSYEEMVGPVRLLQEYEVLFWDSIFDAADDERKVP